MKIFSAPGNILAPLQNLVWLRACASDWDWKSPQREMVCNWSGATRMILSRPGSQNFFWRRAQFFGDHLSHIADWCGKYGTKVIDVRTYFRTFEKKAKEFVTERTIKRASISEGAEKFSSGGRPTKTFGSVSDFCFPKLATFIHNSIKISESNWRLSWCNFQRSCTW